MATRRGAHDGIEAALSASGNLDLIAFRQHERSRYRSDRCRTAGGVDREVETGPGVWLVEICQADGPFAPRREVVIRGISDSVAAIANDSQIATAFLVRERERHQLLL